MSDETFLAETGIRQVSDTRAGEKTNTSAGDSASRRPRGIDLGDGRTENYGSYEKEVFNDPRSGSPPGPTIVPEIALTLFRLGRRI